ncbi:MAG: transmembrane 220 family protein [Pseudomonadota bacterium]
MVVLSVLLFLAALVQLNDPDPVRWAGYYTFCGVLILLCGRRAPALPAVRWTAALVSIASLVLSVALLSENWSEVRQLIGSSQITQAMSDAAPVNEIAKEAGGLMLAGVFLAIAYVRSRGPASGPSGSPDGQ